MAQQTLQFDFPEGIISHAVEAEKTPQILWNVVYDILPMGDLLTRRGAAIAADFNQTVSCKMGCGVCCCQMVPLSPPEAAIIADVVEHLPADRKAVVLAAFERAREKLIAADLWNTISEMYSVRTPKEVVMEVNRNYFELSIPCPFLKDGSCSIYPHRPSRCREYSVLTPSEWCADAFDTRIRRLPLTTRLCESFSHVWASLTGTAPVIIPLVKALDWVEEHNDIRTLSVDDGGTVTRVILEHACSKANDRARARMK